MNNLFQDSPQRAGEDQAIAAIDEAEGNAPALLAGSSTLPTTESTDALGTQESLRRATDDTTAFPLADDVESGRLGKVVGADAEANEGCASGTEPPSPTKPDSETAALYTEIKGIIAGRTRLPESVSALVAFWAISTWFLDAFPVFPLLVISGPAHEAMLVLGVLNDLCSAPDTIGWIPEGGPQRTRRLPHLINLGT